MKAGIRQRQPEEILPVDAGPDGVGGLAIGQRLAKLHDGHERQPPRRQGRLPTRGEERGKVCIREDGAERIAQGDIQIALRKGGMGDPGGLLRHRLHGIKAQRHAGRPSAEWVKAPEISGPYYAIVRFSPQPRERSTHIFTTEIIYVVIIKNPLVRPMPKAYASIASLCQKSSSDGYF